MFNPTRVTEKKRKTKKQKKTVNEQSNLLTGRTKELDTEMEYYKEQLCILKTEQQILNYLIENPESVTITALDLQRYDPNRFPQTWWWCHPELDEMWGEDEDMPKAENYRWGNWKKSHKDVERFVMDRAKWRQPHVVEEIAETEKQLKEASRKMW